MASGLKSMRRSFEKFVERIANLRISSIRWGCLRMAKIKVDIKCSFTISYLLFSGARNC